MRAVYVPYNRQQSMKWLETYNMAGAILSPGGVRDWSIFLGHEGNGMESIRTTFETLLHMNLLEYYDRVLTINATRVFDIQRRAYEERYLYRVLPEEKEGIGPLNINAFPTYYYNKSLVDALGGIAQVETFFQFLQCTILSTQTKTRFDAGRFLRESVSANEFRSLFLERCALRAGEADIDRLFNRRVVDPQTIEAARQLCEDLVVPAGGLCPPSWPRSRATFSWLTVSPRLAFCCFIFCRVCAVALAVFIFCCASDVVPEIRVASSIGRIRDRTSTTRDVGGDAVSLLSFPFGL
jgi:hypothetical protein